MANLNKLFGLFNNDITLSSKKKDDLRKGRNALRDKIRNKFEEKNRTKPKFHGQGSFMMKTTINPINKDDEYDLDDGVYIQEYSDVDKDKWPSASTVHTWILDAVDEHTSNPPMNKNTCVRVIYAKNYHIDLPAYIVKDDVAYLAHKSSGWIESDPKAFTKWFVGKVNEEGEQLRSLVKYLKAWKDYKSVDLKGIEITILVGNNFYPAENRDDLSLLGTVTNIINELEDNFECKKPVGQKEDLFDEASETKKNSIMNSLKKLRDNLQESINKDDEEEASKIMMKCFGSRFPKGEKKSTNSKSDYIKSPAPAILKNDGRSA